MASLLPDSLFTKGNSMLIEIKPLRLESLMLEVNDLIACFIQNSKADATRIKQRASN
jgi:hypothetical protein